MRTRSTLAAVAASALLATACGAGASGPQAQDVPNAMLMSVGQSLEAEVRMDAALDLVELAALLADFPEFGMEDELKDDPYTAQALELMGALSLGFAKADDLSAMFALNVEGTPALAMRTDPGDFAGLKSLQDMLEVSGEATLLAKVDEQAFRRLAELADEEPDSDESFSDMLEEGLASSPVPLPEELTTMLRALAAGEWAGATGTLDMSGLYDTLGMTPEMLEMIAPSTADLPSREDVTRVITDAVTFTKVDDVDGQATFSGDLATDTFLRGAADLYGKLDTTGMMSGMLDSAVAELDVPDLPNSVIVTFDGDDLTSLRFKGAAILAEVVLEQYDLTPERKAEFRSAAAGLRNSRMDLVVTMANHGNVPNQIKDIDATTMPWSTLMDFVAESGLMAPLGGGFGGGFEGGDFSTDFEAGFESEDDARAQSLLRNAAIAQETHYIDNGTYTNDQAALEAEGLVVADDEFLYIMRADEASYCLEAFVGASRLWSFDSLVGEVVEGNCA